MTINVSKQQLFNAVQLILTIAVLGLLIWSQPWNSANAASETRKITVTGDATIESAPDEYVFYPYFEATGKDKDTLKDTLTTKANDAITKLKELGVKDDEMKLDLSSFDNWYWANDEDGTATASITIKIKDKDLTQKIQDYLLTTDAKGQQTPQASFSKDKQKELESEGTDKAIEDAKKKAEQQASKLGAKVGKVIEVGQSSSPIMPIAMDSAAMSVSGSAEISTRSSLPVLVGQNEYTQTVSVTYELK